MKGEERGEGEGCIERVGYAPEPSNQTDASSVVWVGLNLVYSAGRGSRLA